MYCKRSSCVINSCNKQCADGPVVTSQNYIFLIPLIVSQTDFDGHI